MERVAGPFRVRRLSKYAVYPNQEGEPKENYMNEKITFECDREGDILYIDKCSPYPEQESEEIEYGVIARLNPETEKIENREVLFFSQRLLSSK